jgi:hypothetical protein
MLVLFETYGYSDLRYWVVGKNFRSTVVRWFRRLIPRHRNPLSFSWDFGLFTDADRNAFTHEMTNGRDTQKWRRFPQTFT